MLLQAVGEVPAQCASHWHSPEAHPPGPAWGLGLEASEDGQHVEALFVSEEVPGAEPSVSEPSVVVGLVGLSAGGEPPVQEPNVADQCCLHLLQQQIFVSIINYIILYVYVISKTVPVTGRWFSNFLYSL